MPSAVLNLLPHHVSHLTEGQTFTMLHNKRYKKYKLLKKRTTAVTIKRQYWFDDVFDFVSDLLKDKDEEDHRFRT